MFFDSAGKYGAGLALESLGNCLRTLQVKPNEVIISNKLAWVRTALQTPEPTFEPGIWKDLKHDAVQKISYDGMMACFEQGNELLGGYIPQMVSVHDPDEYLAQATSPEHDKQLYTDVLQAYKALFDLKKQGKVVAIGVGAKNWRSIERIAKDVDLDWVMIANSMTLHSHPQELLQFMQQLKNKNVKIINSAVFNGGFLIGGDHYNYKFIDPNNRENDALFAWRRQFFELCTKHGITAAAACARFALAVPGVVSIALSTSSPARVKDNLELATAPIPRAFWNDMKDGGLMSKNAPVPAT